MNTRIEHDSMGSLEVPENALYSAQTQRAINNFPVSGTTMPKAFIVALINIKLAAAKSNIKLGHISEEVGRGIISACQQLLSDDDLMIHFPVDVFQTGSGTSSNMNANEVIANLASRYSGCDVSPNDHVNYGQSSNDVIPTSIHVSAATELSNNLLPALEYLEQQMRSKAEVCKHHVKTGRTHLMDAMPITMAQSINSWADQIALNIQQLSLIIPSVNTLAQGGTAVGTGVNADPLFAGDFCLQLNEQLNASFTAAERPFNYIATQDVAVGVSGALKTVATSIMKISNDLRWMNSGPLAGLGEITLEALQPGSSIMPGKVNPVIPEAACMVAAQVIGNDSAITIGGQSGNFELNVMLPMIAANLLQSIELLSNISHLLADKAITTFEVNEEQIKQALSKNPILVTALNPIIGYKKAAEIAKIAYKEKRPIVEVAKQHTDLSLAELENLLDPAKLTEGGIA